MPYNVVWLPVLAIHAFAYIRRTPRLIVDDWNKHPIEQTPGRGSRLGVNLGALALGVIAAILLLPFASPWITWIQTNESGPGFFIAGMSVSAFALLVSRYLRWW